MREVTGMILDGTIDAVTGEYIGESCNYPRSYTKDNAYSYMRKNNRVKQSNKPKVKKMRDRW